MSRSPGALLVVGASEVVTMAGGPRRGTSQDEPRSLAAAAQGPGDDRPAVAAIGDRLHAIGALGEVRRGLAAAGVPDEAITRLDAAGGTVTPGLIDPHTHLLFGGTREREAAMRAAGARYLDILAAGGGILSTVAATRAASDEQLLAHGRRWLAEMLRGGTTTVEAKSGYGLDLPSELRLLALADRLGREGPVEVVPTYLGAHAVPDRQRGRPDGVAAYVAEVIGEQLPGVADQGIARFCDVFCERGVFDVDAARRILAAARKLGLGLRLHADQLAASGGAHLAAEMGASSADHLAAVREQGITSLARAAGEGRPVVATLLPATGLFLGEESAPPARRLIDSGVPVALGSDFNPGTAPTASLPLVVSLAWLKLGMTAAEALAGVTINAAAALGVAETHGSLESGKQADLVVWDVPRHELLPYLLGAHLVRAVVKRGRIVYRAQEPAGTAARS